MIEINGQQDIVKLLGKYIVCEQNHGGSRFTQYNKIISEEAPPCRYNLPENFCRFRSEFFTINVIENGSVFYTKPGTSNCVCPAMAFRDMDFITEEEYNRFRSIALANAPEIKPRRKRTR